MDGSSKKSEDPKLIEAVRHVQQGRVKYFKYIFHKYYNSLVYFFKKDASEHAEDLTQETFIRVYKGIHEFQWRSSFDTWIFRIAINVKMTYLETRKRRKEKALVLPLEEAPVELLDDNSTPIEEVLQKEVLEKLHEAVDSLPPRMRQCIKLRYSDGLSYQEIATLLQITEETVHAHLEQGKRKLSELLGKYLKQL